MDNSSEKIPTGKEERYREDGILRRRSLDARYNTHTQDAFVCWSGTWIGLMDLTKSWAILHSSIGKALNPKGPTQLCGRICGRQRKSQRVIWVSKLWRIIFQNVFTYVYNLRTPKTVVNEIWRTIQVLLHFYIDFDRFFSIELLLLFKAVVSITLKHIYFLFLKDYHFPRLNHFCSSWSVLSSNCQLKRFFISFYAKYSLPNTTTTFKHYKPNPFNV